ncbi:DUF3197 domain-containing protein [Thermus scotoductus]|uniref:DUF3197 domain-containing protein n=1 Tax=Thermus scotoductus TaxID=37636 RepID=A0A430S4B2_THESC|nr:DUF3197 domain-containing protein [Thermus scotoductus]RTG92254.1 DUF3197 domain-containing protein [Thermus scotoductus]RTG94652.1 DUF3197 domain-containing protein [Thermus scotoductus]RTH03778.1 DUF3197 domain-containing protein [Thermus scotoductus]RTH06475.1 DUF3197 domain-containing protein [Thermus scotoductus]RTH07208.1 DUF3197 domain-containing protein [Thermus scotoductus]
MERVGLRASPRITLEALKEALKGVRFPEAKVYFITDWQDRRHQARYALLIHGGKKDLLTPDAFGPAFRGGEEALAELVDLLLRLGAKRFYEAVVSPAEMTALLELPPEELVRRINAIANPTDPGIYLKRAA